MHEHFVKVNDYTLRHIVEDPERQSGGYTSGLRLLSSVTRTFNYMSAQVTTQTRDLAYELRGSNAGGAASVSTQTLVQNFSDLQSDLEIRMMHRKLIELGGQPPALDNLQTGRQALAGKPRLETPRTPNR